MSHPLSEQTEVRLNESISQVSAFAVNEIEEDEEDIYGEQRGERRRRRIRNQWHKKQVTVRMMKKRTRL
jgi:hypothetical protein